MMTKHLLTDYNGSVWVKTYDEIIDTSFFKSIPDNDSQKQTDSLVEDIKYLINNN